MCEILNDKSHNLKGKKKVLHNYHIISGEFFHEKWNLKKKKKHTIID